MLPRSTELDEAAAVEVNRLVYVAITRARDEFTFTCAHNWFIRQQFSSARLSFLPRLSPCRPVTAIFACSDEHE